MLGIGLGELRVAEDRAQVAFLAGVGGGQREGDQDGVLALAQVVKV